MDVDALTQQYLVKHGDVLTIRTLNMNSGGAPGWVYLDTNEAPQVAHGVDLPISDRKFLWQVLKLSPNVSGGNQNPIYVTEGDDVILKSMHNGLALTLHGLRCGVSSAKAQLGEQIAVGNYYTSGQGGLGTLSIVDATGGATRDRAVIYGLRPYAFKFPGTKCFLSMPPHDQGKTAASASQYEAFVLLPPTGALSELQLRAQTVGAVPQIKQETALQGWIDTTHGSSQAFAQQLPAGDYAADQRQRQGQQVSALATAVVLPYGNSVWPYAVGIAVISLLLWIGFYYWGKKSCHSAATGTRR